MSSQWKGSLMSGRRQVLQKDISFSNQIFNRTLQSKTSSHDSIHNHNLNTSSNRINHQNITDTSHNNIPPLVNYYQPPPPLVQHSHQASVITQKKTQLQSPTEQEQQLNQKLNIFERRFKPNFHSIKQSSIHQINLQNYSSIPPLSQLQNTIAKKYQLQQLPQTQQQSNNNKLATVHFNNSQQLFNNNQNTHQILNNIDSLEQSTIANDSIERQNNWIINNIQQNSGFFEDNTILGNLSKKSLNKKNINKSLMNNSFKSINPLQLLNNSLHSKHQPMFVEDDEFSEDNFSSGQKGKTVVNKNNNVNEMNLISIQQRLKAFNTVNKKQQQQVVVNNPTIQQDQQSKRVDYNKLTLDLYMHYVEPIFFNNGGNGDLQTSSMRDSILINDLDSDVNNNRGFDILTTKSTPINYHQQSMNTKIKTVSNINQHLSIQQEQSENKQVNNHYQHQYSTQTHNRQNFIRDNSPQSIISSILSDPQRMKLYLKYLQLKIAKQQNIINSNVRQNYQLLSCLLLKISSITEKGQQLREIVGQRTLAQSIDHVSRVKTIRNCGVERKSLRPQVIRSSSQGIRINFDPYISYQSARISSQISYLKKCLQEKTKQQQLIKIHYDSIIHNYANTLENLAKNNTQQQRVYHSNSVDRQSNYYQNNNNDEPQSLSTTQRRRSQMLQQKMYLDASNGNSRHNDVLSMSSSLDDNQRYRKATFGKVSSFRESGNGHDYYG